MLRLLTFSAGQGGGWVVQITDELLDLDIPGYVETLARVYELLPAIGGRDAPRSPHWRAMKLCRMD